jgi:hypothetical protein
MDLEKDFADSPPKPVTSKSGKIKEMNEWLKGDEERYLTSNGRQYKHPIGDYEHHNTVNALHKDYGRKNASASSSGHGIHRIRLRGKGLSKRAKIEHRIEGEYTKPKPYKQLGRYLINRDKLLDDIVMLKRVGGSHVPDYPSQKVSVPIAAALSSILNQSAPNCDDMSSKDIQELQKILKLCRYEGSIVLKVKGKGIEKSEEDKEMDRFEILKGEIEAGNDNKTLIKEFKLMLVRFMNAGRIPRRQAQDILVDIASMGL